MKAYLQKNPFCTEYHDAHSVVEYLTECYLEENAVSSPRIKEIQKEMEPFFERLPLEGSNRLFHLVYDLCGAYESAAFQRGFLMGLHLADEAENLLKKENNSK